MQVRIYIYHTIKGPRTSKGVYIFILESEVNGQTVTLTKPGTIEGTANAAELMIILEALGRIRKDCTIEVIGVNNYIKQGFERIKSWQENDWKNAKGKEVANKELWQQLVEPIKKYQMLAKLCEDHTYKNWMQREAERILNGRV